MGRGITGARWTGQRILKLRRRLGLSQAGFAFRVGVCRQATVSEWERQVSAPSPLALRGLERLESEAGR